MARAEDQPTFTLADDVFLVTGKPIQLISGSVHYHRIHPAYWTDRLRRVKSMGLNAIQVYVPWNLHEPYPGQYVWDGLADLPGFLGEALDLDLYVLLRPGPYICAEWDFGGLPWWLASSQVSGGSKLQLRTNDPAYLALVDRWWNVLLPKIAPYLYIRGGPILMVQIENEFGNLKRDDQPYLRHLVATARAALGDEVVLYTTDPPPNVHKGSLPGDEVYTAVDFGAGWFNLDQAFGAQRNMNPPGKSPAFCSEFYTGWLTHWGEPMANTSLDAFIKDFKGILGFNGKTGSLNIYMSHGGSNFAFWAGAGSENDGTYTPHITSYDYDAPISEAGDVGQPGIGGPNKFEAIRQAVAEHTGRSLPDPEPAPGIQAFGGVTLDRTAALLEHLDVLYPGDGIYSNRPLIMEDYGQGQGLILYRTSIPAALLTSNAVLNLGGPVHDYATVLLDGKAVGRLSRNNHKNITLPALTNGAQAAVLEVLVEAVGRDNAGSYYDVKGLTCQEVRVDGTLLEGWRVFPLSLQQVGGKAWDPVWDVDANEGRIRADPQEVAHVFYRGTFTLGADTLGDNGHHPDTYLSVKGWGKGVAWVNGFNLGWYWPMKGPQMTMYVPGPVLRNGENEIILLEGHHARDTRRVFLDESPDFYGPNGTAAGQVTQPSFASKQRSPPPQVMLQSEDAVMLANAKA
ncbi:hypothetical protein WJX72_001937 [[Myrmecia] bisecta]|uniref:Beta-galactosidase n=1 Tax=[Myrmecia] bisecta TaxID=41462 RepID=A0AAW1R5R0_9CHLO